ncbi:LysR family transcriptional regulator [Pseudomonas sp. A2]|nr:LysR family transcriptional regulator [Pseudomonas sp. A2]
MQRQGPLPGATGRRGGRDRRVLVHTPTHDQVRAELHGPDLAGRITLGVPDEYAAHVIRDILPMFSAAWPNVVLELRTGPSHALRELVQRGKLQAAVVAQAEGTLGPDAERLLSTTPVWVGPMNAAAVLRDPLPLAAHALQCPYREAMVESLKASGRRSRIILESHSNQAVKACVEAGLAISVIDRAKVTERMQILEGLPAIPDHDILFVRSPASGGDGAVTLLARAMRQSFRL